MHKEAEKLFGDAQSGFKECLEMLEEAKRMEAGMKRKSESQPKTGIDALKHIQSLLNRKL